MKWGRGVAWLLTAVPLLFFGVFYFYPLGSIFRLSFAPDGVWEGEAVRQLWSPFYARTLWFTLWQAVVSTLLTVGLALPASYVFARYEFPAKQSIRAICTLPFVLPTVVVASAFGALLGPRGVINEGLMGLFGLGEPPVDLQYSVAIILLAHLFYNFSVALRLISGFWQNLSDSLPQAAQMLGASPWGAFWRVTWPLLRPAVGGAAVLVFIFCFTSFGVILILGGPRYSTIETEIYRQAVNLFNLPVAAALSLWQILFTFGLMWFYTWTQGRLARPLARERARARWPQTWREKGLVGGTVIFMLGLLGAPLLALAWRSVATAEGISLLYYRSLFENVRGSIFFVPPIAAVRNSVLIALVTMGTAVFLGLISAMLIASERVAGWVRRLLDPLLMLPLATSAVTLGFGYIIALNKPPFNLRDSLALVPVAHTLVAMPFVIRAVLPALRAIQPNLREAAAMLGANPREVWLGVDWPLIRRALLVGAVFAFTMSMGEFGATLFVARPDVPTMPVAIYRFLGQPGALNYGQAVAMSCLLMLVCAVGFVSIERLRLGDEGEF